MPMPCDGTFLIRKTPMPTKMKCPPLLGAAEVDQVADVAVVIAAGMVGEVPVVTGGAADFWDFNLTEE